MKACSITPYEGNQPYIFVSYAHKDSDLVFPIIEELDRRGYRVWYDVGVAPGSEWPEDIATHLAGCYLTISCISPRYILSDNCRRELTFALSKRKNFLAVMVEPTEMSLGLEMQLSAQLMLMRYNYATDAQFFKKLCSCPDLEPCRERSVWDDPDPVPVPEPKPKVEPKPEPVPKPAPEPKPEPVPKPASEPKPKSKPGVGKVVAAVLLLAVLLGVGGWLGLSMTGDVQLTDTVTVERDAVSVTLEDAVITSDTAQKLAGLEHLNTLKLRNCSFEPGAAEALVLPDGMKHLYITDCKGLESLTFLQGSRLFLLDLSGSDVTDAMLAGNAPDGLAELLLTDNLRVESPDCISNCTELVKLDVSGTGIGSLDKLPSEKLVVLNFSGTAVADVTPLAELSGLTNINGANTKVTNIDGLAGLKHLTVLNFNGCNLRKIGGTFVSLELKQLRLSGCGLENIDAFQNCVRLETVDLSHNNLQYIASLEKSRYTLTTLNLNGNPNLNKFDLDFLVWVVGLEEVRISEIPLETLQMFKGLTGLKIVEANHCGLRDISGLSDSTGLEWVELQGNRVTDVSPLGGITEAPAGGLVVDLGGNPLTNLSQLPRVQYRTLCLLDTPVDLATMTGLDTTHIVLTYDEGMPDFAETLRQFSNCCVVACPADRQVELQDAVKAVSGTVGFRLELYERDENLEALLNSLGLHYDL